MKISHLSTLAIMLIIIVVASAGCSSKPQVGSTVSSSSVLNTNYKWIEYQSSGTDIKVEKSNDNYQGSPAVHEKITTTEGAYGTTVTDVYFDTLMKNVLGGTMTSPTPEGQPLIDNINPSLYVPPIYTGVSKDITLTYSGTEAVTVPAGTYSNADLYTYSINGINQYSFWMESGIPVPVKITDTGTTYSLVGWG